MDGLFRKESIEAQQPQWLGETRLALPVSHRVWGLLAALVTIALVAWLFLGHYRRREHVAGRLIPTAGLIRVTARTSGTVQALNVTEGTHVNAGQTLLAVAGGRSSATMGNTGAIVAAKLRDQQAQLRAQLQGLKTQSTLQATGLRRHIASLRDQIGPLAAQIRLQREHVATAAGLVTQVVPLRRKGIVSVVQFDQYKSNALTQKEQLKDLLRQRTQLTQKQNALREQLAQLPLDTANKKHKLRGQLAQLGSARAKNAVTQSTLLHAPVSGVISAVLVKPGQYVEPGQALVTVMPQDAALQAQLLVPSGAIGFVHQGTPVVLHYQAFPYQKFGAQHGSVVQVSRSALTSAEVANLLGQQAPPQPLYLVKVHLARQNIEAYGAPHALLPGMAVTADLMLDRRRMIEWIFEPLYGMARKNGGHT